MFNRAKPSAAPAGNAQQITSTQNALTRFVRAAGPASSWSPDRRTEHSRLVGRAQRAELGIRDAD